MKHTKTGRGFTLVKFTDHYGEKCTLQDSSLAACEGEDWCIWLGISDPTTGRMHLTQSMVRDLLPMLQHFAAHGELPEVDE